MKKTLAIVLSCVLLVAAFFAVAMITSAAEPTEVLASEVIITPAEGEAVTLDATNKTFNGATGTAAFDATTGTLTITDLTGVKKIESFTGSLVLVVKGTNTLVNNANNNVMVNYVEYVDPDAPRKVVKFGAGLTIKGDGTLNFTSNAYAIVGQWGDVHITEKVTLVGETTGTSGNTDVIHAAAGNAEAKIVIDGEANVKATSKGNYTIRAAATGKTSGFYLGGSAKVDIDATISAAWRGGLFATNFEMTGGELNIDAKGNLGGSDIAMVALDVQGGFANFKGGKLTATTVNNKDRAYGLFFKNVSAINFIGTDVTVTVKGSALHSANGIVAIQGSKTALNVTGGSINYTADDTITGFIDNNSEGSVVNVYGGSITGTARSFYYSQGSNGGLNIFGGKINVTSTVSNYTEASAKTFDQKGTATIDKAAKEIKIDKFNLASTVVITPATGDKVTLDIANTTYEGATGKAEFDMATSTLTITDLTGVKSIACTTGSLTVVVKGTNVLDNTDNNNGLSVNYAEYVDPNAARKVLKEGADLTIKGDGKLTVTGKEYVVLCQCGILTVTDKVDLTVNAVKDAMHVSASPSGSGASMVFNGEAKVTVNTTKGWGIRAGADSATGHKITVDEKASVTVNADIGNSWQAAIFANIFEMKSGKVDINVTGTKMEGDGKAVVGLMTQNGAANFAGGEIDIKVENNSNRSYALFFKANTAKVEDPVRFAGTNFTLDVSATSETDAGRGIISLQNGSGQTAPAVEISAGKIAYKGDKNVGLFNYAGSGIVITMTGGELEGTAASFVYNQNNPGIMKLEGGSVNHTSIVKNYTGSNTVSQDGEHDFDLEATTFKFVDNPKSSDFVVSAAAIVLGLSAVAVAAAVVLRKKSYNA